MADAHSTLRTCCDCGQTFPLAVFPSNGAGNGYSRRCTPCKQLKVAEAQIQALRSALAELIKQLRENAANEAYQGTAGGAVLADYARAIEAVLASPPTPQP